MLFGILAAFLAVGAPASNGKAADDLHATLLRQLDKLDSNADELIRKLSTDTVINPTNPESGMLIESAETAGADSLHAVTVVGVYMASPAGRAGILPGDRLIAIGPRRLEHETTTVVYLLLREAASPLPLTVQTKSQAPRSVTIKLEPLPCTSRGAQSINKATVLKQLDELKTVVAGARLLLNNYPDDLGLALNIGAKNVDLGAALEQITNSVLDQITSSVLVTCRVKFADE